MPRGAGPGIAWLLFAVSCYAVMDTLTRLLGPTFGVPLMMVVRYAVHTLVMLLWLGGRRVKHVHVPHASNLRSQLFRGTVLFGSAGLAVMALQRMPVAEYTAVVMLTPVLVTLLAWLVLKHHVTRAQRVLVLGGFLGALIVIRPGSGLFDAAALLALGVALCNAAYQIETNHRGAQEDAVTTNFHAGWVGLGLSLAWLMASSDTSVTALWTSKPVDVLLLMAMALLATVAQLALITALSRANAATLMPFTYAQIGVAALAGWVALGDLPDAWSWVGMAVIAACGAASAWSTARQSMPCPNTLKCTRSTRS